MQGEYVLPTARALYLALAGLCLLAAVIGLATALVLHLLSHPEPHLKPVPEIPQLAPVSLNLNSIQNGFRPPSNIRAIPLSFSRPLTTSTFLVYLDADSSTGLAPYPDDFLILGGADVGLFERKAITVGGRPHTALLPSALLVAQQNEMSGTQQYEVRVAAKDAMGGISEPVLLHITLNPAPIQSPSVQPLTDLEQLARRIAQFVDSAHTPLYFQAFQRAQRIPDQCGAARDDATFQSEYARAFDYMQTRMLPARIEQFYSQLCAAWHVSAQSQMLAAEQAQEARNAVIADNLQAQLSATTRGLLFTTLRNAALVVAGGALALFLFVSLFLAFLAMENHSKAVREAVEALVRAKDGAAP